MPAAHVRWLARWQELHPGWDFRLWTADTLPGLGPLQTFFDDPEVWSPRSNRWQHRANLARYALLWREGGVWIDTDLEPLAPIDALVEQVEAFAVWERQDQWIGNAFMGAEPGHDAIARLLADLPASITSQPDRRSNRQSGAQFLTPRWRNRVDVTVFDQDVCYPYGWNNLPAARDVVGAWVVHHWANARRRAEVAGTVETGKGKQTPVDGLDWHQVGYEPFPGTLNVRIGHDGKRKLAAATRPVTVEIPQPVRTSQREVYELRPIWVNDEIEGHYAMFGPGGAVDVFAPCHLRTELGLADGDTVRLTPRW